MLNISADDKMINALGLNKLRKCFSVFLGQTITKTLSAKLLSDSSPLCCKYCADIIDL